LHWLELDLICNLENTVDEIKGKLHVLKAFR